MENQETTIIIFVISFNVSLYILTHNYLFQFSVPGKIIQMKVGIALFVHSPILLFVCTSAGFHISY